MTPTHVTDGGLETDLLFNHGIDLPEFAAFPLLDSDDGRAALRDYYLGYVDIASAAGARLLLETPTWRANADHAAELGYDDAGVDRINRQAVEFLAALAEAQSDRLSGWEVGGIIGPRGDGYRSDGPVDPDEAAHYHRAQIESFRAAGAARVTALTLTDVGEAMGIARAAADVGLQVGIGFTAETDGRLPDGSTLGDAIAKVDAETSPAFYVINCAHPTHITGALDGGPWQDRIGGLRVNASTMSHAELDEMEVLDDGDPVQLAADQQPLLNAFQNLEVLGGCCGTDARHVGAMWKELA